jgi:hypothetical protein
LGAAQLLPLLELVPYSNRSLNLDQASAYSVTFLQLVIGLLLPSAQGGHELIIYLGLIPLILAPFGLTGQNRWTWFYAALLLFTILFALGPATPVHNLFYQFAPGFRWIRTPARIFFVGSLAISVLVGFAVERLITVEWSVEAKRRLSLVAVAVGLCAFVLGLGMVITFGQAGRSTLALALVVPAGLGLILLGIRGRMSGLRLTILLGLVLFIDLASFDRSLMRFMSLEAALAPGQATAEYLARLPGHFRTYSPSYSLPMQTAAAHGLNLADGVEPVHLADYDRLMARAGGYDEAGFSVTIPNFGNEPLETALRDTQPDLRLLGLLNVRYLAASFPMDWPGLSLTDQIGDVYVYANDYALPRAWVAHQTLPASTDWLGQLETMPDLANVVTITGGPQLPDTAALSTPAQVVRFTADLIELKTEISEPGWLVVSEVWYPGWQATANGLPLEIERVDGLLRGLYLEQPGAYRIVMEYDPGSVIWGQRLAAFSAGLVIVLALWAWVKHR